MELEDLKTTWKSVKPHIDPQINENVANGLLSKRRDIKSRLLKRALWEGIITMICLILMALRGQAEIPVHLLKFGIRSVKFLGV